MNPEWKMPQCFKGQIVLWYEGAVPNEERAVPAVVVKNDHSSLFLRIFGLDRTFDKECVRYMNDPNAKEFERVTEGGWDFCVKPKDSKAK